MRAFYLLNLLLISICSRICGDDGDDGDDVESIVSDSCLSLASISSAEFTDPPPCIPMFSIRNGKVTYVDITNDGDEKNGSVLQALLANLECFDGFIVQGAEQATWTRDQGWNTTLGKCTKLEKECDMIMEFPGLVTIEGRPANLNKVPSGTVVHLTCPEDFILQGPNNFTCAAGQWTEIPECIAPTNCAAIKPIENGYVICCGPAHSVTEYDNGTLAILYCNLGYYPVGPTNVTCESGNWSEIGQCKVLWDPTLTNKITEEN